jgi:sterol desaturase/sphingolipid hydroxylase (fatty acid hydroxylase superfamily)
VGFEWSPIVQLGAIFIFMGVGGAHPRFRQAIVTRDTYINVVTGAGLFAVRVGVLYALAKLSSWESGAVSLSSITHPVAQFLLAFLALDVSRYFVHLASHRVPFLWSFHRVHHSTENLDPTAGLRMHVVDVLILTAIPLTLYGWLFDVSSFASWVVPMALLIGVVLDAFQHSNIAMRMDGTGVGVAINRSWDFLLNNPHFHSWHHTRDGYLRDGNYGNVLTVWDRLFRTCVSGGAPPKELGLPADQALAGGVIAMQRLVARK